MEEQPVNELKSPHPNATGAAEPAAQPVDIPSTPEPTPTTTKEEPPAIPQRPAVAEKPEQPNDENVDTPVTGAEGEGEGEGEGEEEEFVVEKIVGKRVSIDGSVQYKIKWLGYNNRYNCWVQADDMNCPEQLTEYEVCHYS